MKARAFAKIVAKLRTLSKLVVLRVDLSVSDYIYQSMVELALAITNRVSKKALPIDPYE
jgi:hypothetical protein